MHIDFRKDLGIKIQNVYGPPTQTVTSLVYDSREVTRDTAFFCISGDNVNGHQFIEDAVLRGASVIFGSKPALLKEMAEQYPTATLVAVLDTKTAMAQIAAIFYDNSYRKLSTTAVTGTNGKTTVTAYVRSLFNHLALPAGSVGTAGIWDHERELHVRHSTHTTPEAPDLLRALDTLYQKNLQAAAVEVTSIAIAQQRIEGMTFDIGIHTNLTPEHLDFHSSFEDYKQAKLKLFQQVKKAVVNIDDDGMAQDILDLFTGPTLTYGLKETADVSARNIKITDRGTCFELQIHQDSYWIDAPIFGNHNVSNLLAAVCACLHLHIPAAKIVEAISSITGPEGRFQIVNHYSNYRIILDYAHTPHGLQNVVETALQLPHQRFILMITGVGERDPVQRPQMASIAEGQADEIIVSVDHPGFLSRQDIVNDVMEGFMDAKASNIHVILHREQAIHKSLSLAQIGDIVLITGLGFGGYQVAEGRKVPYSDWCVIQNYFQTANLRNHNILFSPK